MNDATRAAAQPWDTRIGMALIVLAALSVVVITVTAFVITRHERVTRARERRQHQARRGALAKGALGGRCASEGCGSTAVREVPGEPGLWCCFACHDELHAAFLDELDDASFPFDQEAAAGVDAAEEWANTHRSAS